MELRKSHVYFFYLILNLVVLAVLFAHATLESAIGKVSLEQNRALAADLSLTDLCLFTEARYTRNPAVADRFSPFQDSPLSLDHFPSGALMNPQRKVNRHDLD